METSNFVQLENNECLFQSLNFTLQVNLILILTSWQHILVLYLSYSECSMGFGTCFWITVFCAMCSWRCHICSMRGWYISLSGYIIPELQIGNHTSIGMKVLPFVFGLPFITCWVKSCGYSSATSLMQSQLQKGGVIPFSVVVIEQKSGQPLSIRTNT